eukprot:TRINITY_DN2392_c0_g3_i5.p1 TRINITY_DN2392_c0_g3~~TRINITY_DN2392_c0_g3_i5.p1  ORF type:complete len:149 (+),score=30.03 TRINITY_DN2392_c0_g3_i5:85-531(+)
MPLSWDSKADLRAMKELLSNYNDDDYDKEVLVSKLMEISSSIPYGTSSVLLSPLHVCAGFNMDVLSRILDHPLLLNCMMVFERNDWGRPILNVAAALDHRNAFSLIIEYYIKHAVRHKYLSSVYYCLFGVIESAHSETNFDSNQNLNH